MNKIVNKMTYFSSSRGEKEIIRRIPEEFVPTRVPQTVNQLIVWKEVQILKIYQKW